MDYIIFELYYRVLETAKIIVRVDMGCGEDPSYDTTDQDIRQSDIPLTDGVIYKAHSKLKIIRNRPVSRRATA